MDEVTMAAVLNEWMRRYTETPEVFEAEFRTVEKFLREMAAGDEPSYGATSVAYMQRVAADLAATGR